MADPLLPVLQALASSIAHHFEDIPINPVKKQQKRDLTKDIKRRLARIGPVLEDHFHEPVIFRYAGFKPEDAPRIGTCADFDVIEFLWDFSFSQHHIPAAIEQRNRNTGKPEKLNGSKFRLLFVVESELGEPAEVCRDLLKLMESRAPIRCLIFPHHPSERTAKNRRDRLARVMANHFAFHKSKTGWLFIQLAWGVGGVETWFFTLNTSGTRIVALPQGNEEAAGGNIQTPVEPAPL